jgi:hypothetical protein
MISARTRAALAAAKVRGVKLGGPKLKAARKNALATIKANADCHAANVLPVIHEIQNQARPRCEIWQRPLMREEFQLREAENGMRLPFAMCCRGRDSFPHIFRSLLYSDDLKALDPSPAD